MVKLHKPEMITNGKDAAPVMYKHQLQATKKTKTFEKDEIASCYIARMSDGRYAVMDANFLNYTKHYEVFTETDLDESFNEIEVLVPA